MKNSQDRYVSIDDYTADDIIDHLISKEKELRKKMNLTQKELAEKADVSIYSIKQFETKGIIPLYTFLLIAEALDWIDDFAMLFSRLAIIRKRHRL